MSNQNEHDDVEALLDELQNSPKWVSRLGRGVYLVQEKGGGRIFEVDGGPTIDFEDSGECVTRLNLVDVSTGERFSATVDEVEPCDGLSALGAQAE